MKPLIRPHISGIVTYLISDIITNLVQQILLQMTYDPQPKHPTSIFMSHNQNAWQNHNINITNKSF
jgi:hypothetical protein